VFSDIGTGQPIITTDGGGGAYWGPVASSSSNTVVLADDPSWNWTGNTNPEATSMIILSGTGAGQLATVKSYTGKSVTLTTPWIVPPDSTSIVSIAFHHQDLTIVNNSFTNTTGTTINLGDMIGGMIEDNTLSNSGSGILLWAFGPYGGPAGYGSVLNTQVLRNTISSGTETDIVSSAQTNAGGIGIFDGTGCIASGLLIRDNSVTDLQTIYSTNGWSGLNAVVIDDNNANVIINGLPMVVANNNTP
jgi:hypothetical protein